MGRDGYARENTYRGQKVRIYDGSQFDKGYRGGDDHINMD
jgi:hypothetical protein